MIQYIQEIRLTPGKNVVKIDDDDDDDGFVFPFLCNHVLSV